MGKVAQRPLLTYFSWVELALDWGVRRFHDHIYMFSNPTKLGKSQTRYYWYNICHKDRKRYTWAMGLSYHRVKLSVQFWP